MIRPIIRVALDIPLDDLYDYLPPKELTSEALTTEIGDDWLGCRVIVPWQNRELVGIVWAIAESSPIPLEKIRPIVRRIDHTTLFDSTWRNMVAFTAQYYQAYIGEVALPAVPKPLKHLTKQWQGETPFLPTLTRFINKIESSEKAAKIAQAKSVASLATHLSQPHASHLPVLTDEQQHVVSHITGLMALHEGQVHGTRHAPIVLQGITGSGKTEVYLRLVAQALQHNRQVLLLVPEINLTPQLIERVQRRFPQHVIACLHSDISDGQRAKAWLLANLGHAQIVLGTRLAVFTPLPCLGLIVIDEEHETSFKQQEGVRYSARDLAIWRAQQVGCPIVLGSATPSLETWHAAISGKYQHLRLTQRAVSQAQLPTLSLIDLREHPPQKGLSAPLLEAIQGCLARQEQVILFHNRRGFAQVLTCTACGWLSRCRQCDAYMTYHTQPQRRMLCHHCGWQHRVPLHCPSCGNADILPLGQGTQQLEAVIQQHFPAAVIARMDRDTTRHKGDSQAILQQVHEGHADILIGTQMIAKGHDFQRVTLVGVLQSDSGLYNHDFRAPERLFALLSQVAGRAGRTGLMSQVLIQTRFPEHPLFAYLLKHDFDGFAAQQVEERQQVYLPPFRYHAMLRVTDGDEVKLMEWLKTVRIALSESEALRDKAVIVSPPISAAMPKLEQQYRAYLLLEADQRRVLQQYLVQMKCLLKQMSTTKCLPAIHHWLIEVDPIEW